MPKRQMDEKTRLAIAALQMNAQPIHPIDATLWTNNVLSPYTITLANGSHPFLVLRHHVERLQLYDFPMGIRVEYRLPNQKSWTLSHPDAIIPMNQHSQIHLRLIGASVDEVSSGKRLALATNESRFTLNPPKATIKLFETLSFDRHANSCLAIYDPDITARENDIIFTPIFLSTRPDIQSMAKYHAVPDTTEQHKDNLLLLLHEAMALATIGHLTSRFCDLASSLGAEIYALKAVDASIVTPIEGERTFLCHEVFPSSWGPITGMEDIVKLTSLQLQTLNTFFHFVFTATSAGGRCLEWIRASDSGEAIVIWRAYMGLDTSEKQGEVDGLEDPRDVFTQRHKCTPLCVVMGLRPF